VNLERALTVSSDSFFYSLGDRYWVESGRNRTGIQEAAQQFGLDEPSGVPLPYEQSGWIPTAERKAERHDENPKAFPEGNWYSGDNINIAIGQGDVLVTPLQLANTYATFANRGTLHAPNIAARVLKPGGDPTSPADVLREFEPRVVRQLDMPQDTWDAMNRGFLGVTSIGTAARAFEGWDQTAWPVAGKTGTAQVEGKADTSVFAAYGPDNGEVQYTIAVILEQSGFGADAAAPVARWILEPLSGAVPLPPARTVEEQESGPPVEQCNDEASVEGSPTSTTTTSTTLYENPLIPEECPPSGDELAAGAGD
jgi:penicillin-binding protein 2